MRTNEMKKRIERLNRYEELRQMKDAIEWKMFKLDCKDFHNYFDREQRREWVFELRDIEKEMKEIEGER